MPPAREAVPQDGPGPTRTRARRRAPGRRLVRHGRQRSIGVHRGDAAVEPERLRLALEAPRRERVLEAVVTAEEIGGSLRADATRTGNPVGRVAAQRDEIGNLARLDPVALAHLRRPDAEERAAAPLRLQDRRLLARELERVAVAARDERITPSRLLVGDGRGEEVVGLVAVGLRDRESNRLAQLRGQVELLEQVGRELPATLVALECEVPVGGHGQRVPRDDHRPRRLLFPEPHEHVADAGQEPARPAARAPD